MKRIATLAITIGFLAALTACESSGSATSPDVAIDDPTGAWALRALDLADGSVVPVPDPSSYTLDLGLTEPGRAGVRADCNLCNGGYVLSAAAIVFGPMACTRAACPPGSLEMDYVRALESATTFERAGRSLTLTYDGGLMRFEER